MARTAIARKSKVNALKVVYESEARETEAQVDARISERFEILDILTEACTVGNARAMIVSGPAGLGKSYTVEEHLRAWDPNEINHTIVKGYVRLTGLIKLLYRFREEGQVIVFDDADTIFFDGDSLNTLKAVCDTTERRRVSYLSEAKLIDDDTAELIPRQFDFHGSIIFITNYDMDAAIERGHKLAVHFEAMISRAHYVDLAMKTRRDYLIRIRQVIRQGLLNHLRPDERKDVVDFIEENHEKLRELSLRMAIKVGNIRRAGGKWKNIAKVTCCRH